MKKTNHRAALQKVLSAVLGLTLAGCLAAPAAQAAAPEDTLDAFTGAMADMIAQNDREDFFSSIVFTRGEAGYQRDGAQVSEGTPAEESAAGALQVPAETFTQAVGGTLTEEDGALCLTAPTGEQVTLSQTTGSAGEGLLSVQSVSETPPPVDTAQTARDLGYTVTESGDSVTITRPYQTARLLVYAPGRELDVAGTTASACYEGMYLLQYATEAEAEAACSNWQETDGVAYAQPDRVVCAAQGETAQEEETAPALAAAETDLGWGAAAMGVDGFSVYLTNLSAQAEKTPPAVVVAVLDTGADLQHVFLRDRFLRAADGTVVGKNTTENTVSVDDITSFHGTHVCGIVADCTTSNVKLMPVKVLGSGGKGSDSTVYTGIQWVIQQAKANPTVHYVINMSLGGDNKAADPAFQTAVNDAYSAGILCVAAAGNEHTDIGVSTVYYLPATLDHVLAVSELKSSGGKTYSEGKDTLSFDADVSNFGTPVDLAAPGAWIYSTVGTTDANQTTHEAYAYKSGTSMAAPHVSAAVALLITAQSLREDSTTPAAIETLLEQHAVTDLGDPGRDDKYGYGAVNLMGAYAPALTNLSADGPLTYGQKLSAVTITGTAAYDGETVAGTFAWKSPNTIPGAGTNVYPVVFTPEDSSYFPAYGQAEVTAAPKAGSLTVTFSGGLTAYTYTGNLLEPAVTVSDDVRTLTPGTDYTVTYADNREIGTNTAQAIVTGIGGYAGSSGTAAFTIQEPVKNQRYLWQESGFTVTYTEATTLTAQTNHKDVATAAVDGATVTITAIAPGKAIITVTVNGREESYPITVLSNGTTLSYTDTSATLTLTLPEDSGVTTVFFAAYQDGKLAGITRATPGVNGESCSLTVSAPGGWSAVKLFCMGGGGVPLLNPTTMLRETS